MLGFLYSNGYGVERCDSKAAEWFLKAAEQDYAIAQYLVGTKKEKQEKKGTNPFCLFLLNLFSIYVWRKKAKKGKQNKHIINSFFFYWEQLIILLVFVLSHLPFFFLLFFPSFLFFSLLFFPSFLLFLLHRFCFQDFDSFIGIFYEMGKGVKKDLPKGLEYLKKAADQGHERAILMTKNWAEQEKKEKRKT